MDRRSHTYSTVREPEEPSALTGEAEDGVLLHEDCTERPSLPVGRFARLPDGRIMSAVGEPQGLTKGSGEETRLYFSDDEGETWDRRRLFADDPEMRPGAQTAFLVTEAGTVVFVFTNRAEYHWTWDDDIRDAPGARHPTYVTRSTDGGDTWADPQMVNDSWSGDNRDIIQTESGAVVFTSMRMQHDPGRHACLTYRSPDDGRSWGASNHLEFGGSGHHDGLSEGTIVELESGELLQYLRTNWDQFWLARSEDDGRSWHPYGPSGVDASGAPGMLRRLESGRIALVWNRLYPEGEEGYELHGGEAVSSATPRSSHRQELSISFSEDEAESWSPPVVLGRDPDISETSGVIGYPFVFEVEPGRLWITARRHDFAVEIHEEEFLR